MMIDNSFYNNWGFIANPFQITPLKADEEGYELIAGRDKELKTIIQKLKNPPKVVTIEGSIGIGKTSLVNVATYKLFEEYKSKNSTQLFLPCIKSFQLDNNHSSDDFILDVLLSVCQTLLKYNDELSEYRPDIRITKELNQWLNSPMLKGHQGSFSISIPGVGGVGGGTGNSISTNNATGFLKSGFQKTVIDLLSNLFPSGIGGVVCIIDNLELLDETAKAKKLLEELRDRLLNTVGIRFVICGALGMVRGVFSSQRLEGILSKPIEIKAIDQKYSEEIFEKRRTHFALDSSDYYLPIEVSSFNNLYIINNENIRNTISATDEYCSWIVEKEYHPISEDEKTDRYTEWFSNEGLSKLEAVEKSMNDRLWSILVKAKELGGEFSQSDYEIFGYKSAQAFRPSIKRLEEVNLFQSIKDDTDKRRKTISVTTSGFIVYYFKYEFED